MSTQEQYENLIRFGFTFLEAWFGQLLLAWVFAFHIGYWQSFLCILFLRMITFNGIYAQRKDVLKK